MSVMNDMRPTNGRANAPRSDRNDARDDGGEREDRSRVTHDAPGAADLDQPARVDRRPLVIAMAITTTFFIVELVGSYITH